MAKHTAETYTDAELLALWRQAAADVAASGQSSAIRGKSLTRANGALIERMIRFFESKVGRTSGRPGYTLIRRVRG